MPIAVPRIRQLVPLLLAVTLATCAKKGEGEACTSDSECEDGLTCDRHGRESGTCYRPHGHGPANGTDAGGTALDGGAGADGSSGGTGGSSPAAADAGGAGGMVGTDAPPVSPDVLPDAPSPTLDAPPPDRAPETSAANACVSYCECMMQSCSTQNGYPFASNAACIARCDQLTELQRSCWSRFCTMAGMQSQSMRGHTCEHAWGELGTGECQ
jgi:hypothetical protein